MELEWEEREREGGGLSRAEFLCGCVSFIPRAVLETYIVDDI